MADTQRNSAAIDAIVKFWFGELDETGMSGADYHRLWFSASPETDARCRRCFGERVVQAVGGELDNWADSDWTHGDQGLVALVLLLDQFTRNIYRDTPAAFAGDAAALALAQRAIETGRYQRLPAIHQAFLYMPLEHCEDPEVQDECVTLFEELTAITGSEQMAGFTRYAIAHRDVIAQFGRFPHRNAILGRESTPAELAYLEQHGGF
jgi:uncharacterized protein (DUF924 family)